ncbi:MAG: hypothetical protein DMF44_13275 [Verrucomicrobia bacterium]|nr:MAG: hypothetical protein DMF44_13275 [Verrucomicrobiota bacterium]
MAAAQMCFSRVKRKWRGKPAKIPKFFETQKRTAAEKRCEDAPHFKSIASKIFLRSTSISVIRRLI